MVPKDTSFPHYIWPTYKVLISKYTITYQTLTAGLDLTCSLLEPSLALLGVELGLFKVCLKIEKYSFTAF